MNKRKPIRECVALTLIKSLGARRIYRLLQEVDHPQEIFRLTEQQLLGVERVGKATAEAIITFNDWQKVDQIIERTEKIGSQLITLNHRDYPPLLKHIYDPPLLLWVLGDLSAINRRGLAVVGTRRPSDYGLKQTRRFTGLISQQGTPVISGLAHGIDTEAHRTAIRMEGITVAVLGSGIDVVYPAANRKLAGKIIHSGGAIISEFPPGTEPESGNFPVRNRIVSGMTLGTLVVESGREGGSMITASSASDQNREVFAIPHELGKDSGEGCNAMIRRGHAKLVQDGKDLWEELPIQPTVQTSEIQLSISRSQTDWKELKINRTATRICTLLEKGPIHIDDLADKLSISTGSLMAELLDLEMKQCVRQRPGKVFELI